MIETAMTPDAELLRCYAEEKSEAAFAELVHRHLPLVYSAALRRMGGDAHGAGDVTQQVFTTLARRAAHVARHPVLTAWLYTSTRNAAIDLLRAQQRRRLHEQEAHTMDHLTGEASNPEWEKLRPVLDGVIDELNETDRTAVLLRFFEKRSFSEIGAALRLSEDAGRMRVERALAKLHALLKRRGVTSSATALSVTLVNHSGPQVPGGLAGAVSSNALAAASIASGTTTLTPVLNFMSTMKLTASIAAAAVIIIALGGGAYAVRAPQQEQEAARLAERRANARLEQVRSAERQTLAVEQEVEQLRQRLAEEKARLTATGATATATATTAPAVASDPSKEGDAFMARHPEVKAALGDYARARVNFRFGELYRKLGLTPEQIDRFQALVARAGMGSEGPNGRDMQLRWSPEKSADATHELENLLGPAGMKMYRELNQRDESRNLAVHIAGALWPSEDPLTPVQADQLVEVLANNRVKSGERTARSRVDWDVAIAKARSFLSPVQLVMLEAEKAHELHQRVLFDR
jgi:RNA polymerase sigma factor (sigma-70 family)